MKDDTLCLIGVVIWSGVSSGTFAYVVDKGLGAPGWGSVLASAGCFFWSYWFGRLAYDCQKARSQ
jgi:hypothetical protein